MDNRETLTPSSSDAILKRHLFSGVTKNWIKGGGNVVYFVRRLSRQSFGFRVAASSGPIPKAPGSAGGYLQHDPEKWVPVFPRDKREAFARRSCSNKKIERDDDSKK